MRRSLLGFVGAAAALLFGTPFGAGGAPSPQGFLIRDARVVDGTGAPARVESVRVRDGRIAAIGALSPTEGETVVDATGLVLAPGFVDTHSHHDGDSDPLVPAAISQGITTIVVGQDGSSQFPLADFWARLEAEPRSVHVASYSGHNTLRERILGRDFGRHATAAEVEAMRALLRLDLEAGALGLSTGLEYDPGIYSDPEEVLALAREASAAGGRYISHVRSEDRWFEDAVDELLHIGREAEIPVQISHMKLAKQDLWGETERILAKLDAARAEGIDVTADVYPYTRWQSNLGVLFPERDFQDRDEARYALTQVTRPDEVLITRFDPEPSYVGETLAEVARRRGEDPETTLMALLALVEAAGPDAEDTIIAKSMTEEDVAALLAWPHANLCSDGDGEGGHPRGWGSFPRFLRLMVREQEILTLEEAIHKMTGLSAAHVGLADRGVIREGAPADLVLFDLEAITDVGTFEDPARPSRGIHTVWVEGVAVYRDGEPTGERPGRVLRRRTAPDFRLKG